MERSDDRGLFELADLILAVGRHIRSPSEHSPEWCTPVESTVMRFIDGNPGTSARAVAESTLLPSGNASRILRGLERKGLVRREADPQDARGVCLNLTPLARQNRDKLRELWSGLLDGTIDDPAALDLVTRTLRRIEGELLARRRRSEGIPSKASPAGSG